MHILGCDVEGREKSSKMQKEEGKWENNNEKKITYRTNKSDTSLVFMNKNEANNREPMCKIILKVLNMY